MVSSVGCHGDGSGLSWCRLWVVMVTLSSVSRHGDDCVVMVSAVCCHGVGCVLSW